MKKDMRQIRFFDDGHGGGDMYAAILCGGRYHILKTVFTSELKPGETLDHVIHTMMPFAD